MGKPSEASHSGGNTGFCREALELGGRHRSRGQQVVFMGSGEGLGKGRERNWAATQAASYSGEERLGNLLVPLKDCV